MKLLGYLLPILCAAGLSTVRANPIYTVTTGYGTYEITTVDTSFAADAAVLEAMPWWGNVGLTYALSSTLLQIQHGYNSDGSNLAVFAIDPATDFSLALDVNGDLLTDYTGAIAVNTNNPAIGYPYISDEAPQTVLPYVVLESAVSSVPDTSSTWAMLSLALGCGVVLRRKTGLLAKSAGSRFLPKS